MPKTLQAYCDDVESSTRKKHIGSNLLEQNQFIPLNIWVRLGHDSNTAKKQSTLKGIHGGILIFLNTLTPEFSESREIYGHPN
jgi:hypothetical protein